MMKSALPLSTHTGYITRLYQFITNQRSQWVCCGGQLSTMEHCFLEIRSLQGAMVKTGNGRILKTQFSSRNKMCKRNWMHRKFSVLVYTVHFTF